MNRKKGLFITIFSFAGEEGIMEIQGTPASRARVLKVLRFDSCLWRLRVVDCPSGNEYKCRLSADSG